MRKLYYLWTAVAISSLTLFCLLCVGCGKTDSSTETGVWKVESGIRIVDGVSTSTVKLSNGSYRTYYVGSGGILSAISTDGLTFTLESGKRVDVGAPGEPDSAQAVNPCVVALSDGYRMYYDGLDGSDPSSHTACRRVLSAVSSDGLVFTKEGIRIDSKSDLIDNDKASVPDIIKLANGNYLMAYVYDMYGANSIRAAISTNEGNSITTHGAWTRLSTCELGANAMDPDLIYINGILKMYYAQTIFTSDRSASMKIISATSSDNGNTWTKDADIAVVPTHYTTNLVGDPDIVETSAGNFRLYYYEFKSDTGSDIFSATYP
ncbi:MAG: hypothetical protein PHG97_04250 [Candidatus Margulisbacteria bacterium]|nr:hypothetical protein [Candidatus Margulisiibacteriota bacterium]